MACASVWVWFLMWLSLPSVLAKESNEISYNFPTNFDISGVISKYFNTCDVFVTDDDILQSTDLRSSLARILFTDAVSTPTYSLHLSSYLEENGWNSSKCSKISCFPVAFRRRSHCSLLIGLFFGGTSLLERFNELFFDPYAAPLRNGRDYSLLFTSPEIDEEEFLLHKSLRTVKFKLGISLLSKTSNRNLLGASVCFFCNQGNSKVEAIDVTESASLEELFPDYTKNGFGRNLRASAPTKYPFLYEIQHVGSDKWVSKRGVYFFALNALLPHFNFSFTPYPSRNGGSGTHFSNDTWDGVIGDMIYDQADFGTAASANPERYLIVSFTNFPISYIFVTFMMGPPKITYTWKAIYWPFSPSLWLGLVLSMLLVIFIFKLMDNLFSLQKGLSIYRHLSENICFALIGQSYECSGPEAHSARLLLAVWLFATIIFSTLYVSQVVGLLAFPLYQEQPLTFKALTESEFKWGFDRSGGSLFAHFKHSTNPIFHEIFERKLPEQDAIDCFNMAVREEFACVTWSGVADYTAYKNMTLKHGKSPLVFASEKTQFIPSGIMLPRRSLHKDNFNRVLGMLVDSGQDEKWLAMDYENLRKGKVKWQHSLGLKGDDDAEDDEDLLSLSNLLGIFYIYIAGHVLSLVLFVWEKIKEKKGATRDETRDKVRKTGKIMWGMVFGVTSELMGRHGRKSPPVFERASAIGSVNGRLSFNLA